MILAVVMKKNIHPFMIAVQFHPERLSEDNVIRLQIKEAFYRNIY